MQAAFVSVAPILGESSGRQCVQPRCRRRGRECSMSLHRLRPSTLAWVLPVPPSCEQAWESSGGMWGISDSFLISLLLYLLRFGVLSFLPLVSPVLRAAIKNARARRAPHAAILLGTIHNGVLSDGYTAVKIGTPSTLRNVNSGAAAAALVFANEPSFSKLVHVEQVYIAARNRFLRENDRVRRPRLLKVIEHAYRARM